MAVPDLFDPELDTTLPDWYVNLLVAANALNMLTLFLDGFGLFVLTLQN